jgi:hypothetical protein
MPIWRIIFFIFRGFIFGIIELHFSFGLKKVFYFFIIRQLPNDFAGFIFSGAKIKAGDKMRISVFLIGILLTGMFAGCLGSRSASEGLYDSRDSPEYAAAPSYSKSNGFQSVLSEVVLTPKEIESPPQTAGTSTDRKIIKTGRISIEVEDFDTAASAVEGLAATAGGFISNSNSYITSEGQKRGTITIRIPAEGFESVLDEVKKLGEVKSTSSSGQDVTEEYIDLEARLKNYQRQEERFLAILDNATTVEDVLKVEEQLGRVRGEIERIEGRLRYLDNYIDLSTITVEISEPVPITHTWGIRDALSDSVEGFIGMTNGLIVFTGSMIPLVIFVALLYGVFKLVRRKKKSKEE